MKVAIRNENVNKFKDYLQSIMGITKSYYTEYPGEVYSVFVFVGLFIYEESKISEVSKYL